MTWTTNWWFVQALRALAVTWETRFWENVLVGAWRACRSAWAVCRVEVLIRRANCLWTVLSRISRQTVAYSSGTKTVLTAPVLAYLSWINAIISKIRTFQVPSQSTDRFFGPWLWFQTVHCVCSHSKAYRSSTRRVAASIRITAGSAFFWDWRSTKGACNAEGICLVLLESELFESIIALVWVHTMMILSPHAASVSHQCCLLCAYRFS